MADNEISSYGYVSREDLVSVANAIRSKTGSSGSLEFPAGFVTAINSIEAGYVSGDINKTVTGNICGTETPDGRIAVCGNICGNICGIVTYYNSVVDGECTLNFSNGYLNYINLSLPNYGSWCGYFDSCGYVTCGNFSGSCGDIAYFNSGRLNEIYLSNSYTCGYFDSCGYVTCGNFSGSCGDSAYFYNGCLEIINLNNSYICGYFSNGYITSGNFVGSSGDVAYFYDGHLNEIDLNNSNICGYFSNGYITSGNFVGSSGDVASFYDGHLTAIYTNNYNSSGEFDSNGYMINGSFSGSSNSNYVSFSDGYVTTVSGNLSEYNSNSAIENSGSRYIEFIVNGTTYRGYCFGYSA